VASRVTEGGLLPEVEVRGVQVQRVRRLDGADDDDDDDDEGLLVVVREAVVRQVVEGLRGELVRELMEWGS
jgi:hypothetical protein